MPRRHEHNIESNCVSFDDSCFDETNSYNQSITEMNKYEEQVIKSVVRKVYNTGAKIVKEITNKIKGN